MKRFAQTLAASVALLFSLTVHGGVPAIPDIMPQPRSIEVSRGSFKARGAGFKIDSGIDEMSKSAIRDFAAALSVGSGEVSAVTTPFGLARSAADGKIKGFVFLFDGTLGEEAYTMEINSRFALVSASSYNGFLYALQTLRQMLPVAVYGRKPAPKERWKLPCVKIEDSPRFAYRGMHMDPVRHFFPVEEVKKYLDIMATYKLNRLHWHLTDDQGWRIEVKGYPALAEIGGFREGTMVGKHWGTSDGIRYGGYYTQEQIREVVAYAQKLGITIIPEIDLPGHMLAALSAYPEFGCTGGPYKASQEWGVFDDVLCVGKEETFTFLENVLGEIADLFPGEYFHIGGDECPKTRWKECPDCQALIAKLGLVSDEHASAEQYLQNYVTSRMQAFLATKGKKIIGWDEILEGELSEGATVMSWRGTDGGIKAAGMGFDVIMTPVDYCYFDYYQSQDKDKEPMAFDGYVPVEKVYSFDPVAKMDASAASHVLGVQANLWTEYIPTSEQLEYMLLPRMQALSEVQWCSPENRSFERWSQSEKTHQYRILDILGYNYRPLDD